MLFDFFPIGEQAHIVAENPRGPRGVSTLSVKQRNSYENLILLCPSHHQIIDKDEASYPVARLQEIKAEHEAWVNSSLSKAETMVISGLLIFTRALCGWLKDSMTIKHGRDPEWLSFVGYASTCCLGAYYMTLSVLYAAQVFIYIMFAKGGEVTIVRQIAAMSLLIIFLLGGRICGATTRNSWWQLKQLF
jgi:hypothetical protein